MQADGLAGPLRGLAQQLWFAVDDDVRFAVGRVGQPAPRGYRVVERYAVVPSARRPRMLLPTQPVAARGSALNYRSLRGPRERAVRAALGAAARVGFPTATTVLQVLVPAERPAAASSLPLHAIAHALGGDPLQASVGVRTGANRKATLQLVHADGSPAGYAKVGWNSTSDDYVRTESAALTDLAGGTGRVRVPRKLAALEHGDHPVLVTEPLPTSVRAVRPGRGDDPTSVELHDLSPVVRTGPVGDIRHLRALRTRLAGLSDATVAEPAAWAGRLLDQATRDASDLAVAARWHGDLTPWNTARDADGTLWVWDWESSEPDAPAGLDALHWSFSVHRETAGPGGITLTDCLSDAAPHLTALGAGRRTWPALVQVYLAVTIERACGLAAADGGWERLWIQPHQLHALARQAESLTPTS